MTLLAIALLLAAGWPLSGALDPEARGGRRAGESLLFGAASAVVVLQFLAIAGIEWNRLTLAIPVAAISMAAWAVSRRSGAQLATSPLPTGSRLWYALDAVTIILVLAHLLYSSLLRPYEWDYFGIWGFRGHLFFSTRSISWPPFRTPDFDWSKPGHPLLTPILYDVVAVVAGRWNDARFGLLATAFGAALIVIVRGLVAAEHGSRFRRAAVTLALTPAALSTWIGLAEPFLIAYATAGVLLVRRGLRDDSRRSLTAGALFLGCAVMTKDEGGAFLLAAAVGVFLASRRRWRAVLDLWPALAIAMPWILIRSRAGADTGILGGDVAQRILRIQHPFAIFEAIFATPVANHVFWWAAIAAIVLCFRQAWIRERFLLVVIVVQFASYVAQNFVVPWEVATHILYSWNRLIDQLAATTVFTAAMLLISRIEGPTTAQTPDPLAAE